MRWDPGRGRHLVVDVRHGEEAPVPDHGRLNLRVPVVVHLGLDGRVVCLAVEGFLGFVEVVDVLRRVVEEGFDVGGGAGEPESSIDHGFRS